MRAAKLHFLEKYVKVLAGREKKKMQWRVGQEQIIGHIRIKCCTNEVLAPLVMKSPLSSLTGFAPQSESQENHFCLIGFILHSNMCLPI